MNKKFDFIDRLVAFAGDVILFVEAMPEGKAGVYLFNQLMRSSGSAVLNFTEAQNAHADEVFIAKSRIALKELRESQVSFQILNHVEYGSEENREDLEQENVELIKILVTIIKNREAK
ncbi:MAG: four helix bundle protein [Flavobacteriales bacterium]|jgi:four helix bundle protein|tara:strand:+ start:499 stop:852 length:354 start_codon:yes stop_codon:yes gene_type:complete